MATIGSNALTYSDWAKRVDDGGRIASIIDAGMAELVARVRKCVDCCHDDTNVVGGCDKAEELAEIIAEYSVPK